MPVPGDVEPGPGVNGTLDELVIGRVRLDGFQVSRRGGEHIQGGPLLAILPGVALQQPWDTMGTAESALLAVSIIVVATGLLGMMTMTLAGLNERRREMAILRSVGARPAHIFGLLVTEAGALAALGAILGLAGLCLALFLLQPWIVSRYGLFIPISPPAARDWLILGAVVAVGLAAGFIPAWRGYRYSVADGMIVQT